MEEFKRYVLGFVVCPETKEVLLIQKLKPEFQKGCYNGIGGKIEDKETPEYAMYRECKEETGLEIEKDVWKNFAVMRCKEGSKDKVSKAWDVECFIAFVGRKTFYQYDSMEEEKVARFDLFEVHTNNLIYNFLGNISWLVSMGIDFVMNKQPFNKVVIEYTGLSKTYQL